MTKIPRMRKETENFIKTMLETEKARRQNLLMAEIESDRATYPEAIKLYRAVYKAYDDFMEYVIDMEELE